MQTGPVSCTEAFRYAFGWYSRIIQKNVPLEKKIRIFTKHPVKMCKIVSSTILLFLFLSETNVLDDGIMSLLFLF